MAVIKFRIAPKKDVTVCYKNGPREIYPKIECLGLETSPVLLAFHADINRENVAQVIIEEEKYAIIDPEESDADHVIRLKKL